MPICKQRKGLRKTDCFFNSQLCTHFPPRKRSFGILKRLCLRSVCVCSSYRAFGCPLLAIGPPHWTIGSPNWPPFPSGGPFGLSNSGERKNPLNITLWQDCPGIGQGLRSGFRTRGRRNGVTSDFSVFFRFFTFFHFFRFSVSMFSHLFFFSDFVSHFVFPFSSFFPISSISFSEKKRGDTVRETPSAKPR